VKLKLALAYIVAIAFFLWTLWVVYTWSRQPWSAW